MGGLFYNKILMKTILNIILSSLLFLSLSLNMFLRANQEVNCDNIDARWKADLLYSMWHRNLDWDKDWVACENLPYNQN